MKTLLALALLIAAPLVMAVAAATWTIQTSGSPGGPWTNAASGTSAQMFARLAVSNSVAATVGIGGVVTITNPSTGSGQAAAAVLSNGVLTITAAIASNSLKQIQGMTSTNIALKLNLVGQ
ncbi:MAG: hypothetical protein ABSA12_10495 [Verrucomicrobiia bacterium]|jgi:hypothetical protein